MVIEILSYKASILNPLFKFLVIVLYAIGTWFFYRAWRKYGGNLKIIAGALMCGGIAACIGASARFLGDYLVQFKWMESTGAIIFALISIFVAWLVYRKFSEIAVAFGLKEEK
ncbi:hypothetical protein [Methanoregula sp.]|jgi:O-antigen/teichoic acid export membrane protein|uniref:hypothetical protein n=1 Tax=Methanoregula sp. TaxID=2052170 RepID=UPI0026200DD3|nr:hypothetical protein [Methanoregula sp.]MDD5144325.1 hypothetical protein [Methanoregula sp.]